MTRRVLLLGFGPFHGIQDNPSGRLAAALDGERLRDRELAGRELPVSFRRAPRTALEWVRRLQPELVIALGVAGREGCQVETVARNRVGELPDVDGESPAGLGPGPGSLEVALPVEALARGMGARLSTDAGSYVCNALLYHLLRDASAPAVFVHVPPEGIAPERLRRGIASLLEELDARAG